MQGSRGILILGKTIYNLSFCTCFNLRHLNVWRSLFTTQKMNKLTQMSRYFFPRLREDIFLIHCNVLHSILGNSYRDRRSLSQNFLTFFFNNIIVLTLKRQKKCRNFRKSQYFSSFSLYKIVFSALFNITIHCRSI